MSDRGRRSGGSRAEGAGRPRAANARRVAFDVLQAVRRDDAYANLLLPTRIADARLSPADAGFATELAYGTLRRRGSHDALIALAAKRDTAAIDPDVLDVLRLGVHQLLEMRVPSHAAVDQSVQLARAVGASRASGFVNGVLRTVDRTDAASWRDRITAGLSGDALLAAEHSHPEWVVTALRASLAADGREGELAALLAADNVAPAVQLVELPGLGEAPEAPDAVSPLARPAPPGDPASDPDVAAGRARVQDPGSQLAALVLSRARPVAPGERWVDLCAGPGGKAALLAAEARLGGARLLANEVAPARARLVRAALKAVDPDVEVRTGDGRTIGDDLDAPADRILLDAPCTGLGALRRRPEARWRKQPEDVAELAALQDELLDAAVAALAPGGLLAYVTCSPHLAETRERVDAALARHPDLVALDTRAIGASISPRDLGDGTGPALQLWPHRDGSDAMFMQLFERRA